MRILLAALVTLTLAACAHSAATESPAQAAAAAPASQPTAEARQLVSEAGQLYEASKYAEALPRYRKAWELGQRDPSTAYDAACTAALAGEKAEALTWLERAADAGFGNSGHLGRDPDLATLRAEPAYARIAEKVAANEAKLNAAQDPALRDEILKMVEVDQAARMELARGNFKDEAAKERLRAIDTQNTARMKDIIARKGWPTRTLVGQRASHAAWLLVQHADLDLEFQKQCLPLLEKAVAQGEATPANLAYLTDRVLVAEKKPQRYGTQFHEVDGKQVPQPIEDEANVDARRAAVGLGTLAEYAAQFERMRQMNSAPASAPAK
jgi:tetratricopeptide (TPR) repeat protein